MRLFHINELLENLLSAIEAQGGELSPEAGAALESLEMERSEKLLDLGCAYMECESEAEAIKKVETSLAERRRTLERRAEWLKRFVAGQIADGETMKDGRCRLSWRKSTSVEITDPGAVPDKYLRYKPPEPDKAMLKVALEAGPVAGAQLVTKNNLQIN